MFPPAACIIYNSETSLLLSSLSLSLGCSCLPNQSSRLDSQLPEGRSRASHPFVPWGPAAVFHCLGGPDVKLFLAKTSIIQIPRSSNEMSTDLTSTSRASSDPVASCMLNVTGPQMTGRQTDLQISCYFTFMLAVVFCTSEYAVSIFKLMKLMKASKGSEPKDSTEQRGDQSCLSLAPGNIQCKHRPFSCRTSRFFRFSQRHIEKNGL